MLQGRGASHDFLSMQNIDVEENKNNMPDCFFLAHVEDSLFLFVVSFSASRLGGLGSSMGCCKEGALAMTFYPCKI